MKQVIVIRRDLKMRRGKEIAQGCHASTMAILRILENESRHILDRWLGEFGMRKICCRVDSEEQIKDLYQQAISFNLPSYLVKDEGLTEFGGVANFTALAIGPELDDKIDQITKDLVLY